MNLKKTVNKIEALTKAVKDEAKFREEILVAHGQTTSSLLETARKGYQKMVTAIEVRQAKKAIKLNQACREAQQCLEKLNGMGDVGDTGVEQPRDSSSVVLQPAVDKTGNPA